MKQRVITMLIGVSLLVFGGVANAANIGFDNETNGDWFGPSTEDGFTLSLFSGALFAQVNAFGLPGNPLPNMEGLATKGGELGGILSIKRTDGGLFTFNGADVAQSSLTPLPARMVDFEGFLGGSSLGVDSFLTSPDESWTTYSSSILRGVVLDELRIKLDAQLSEPGEPFYAEALDNVNLYAVPVPFPSANIEKRTNGNQADGADDPDVPQIDAGAPVTWTYEVSNTGVAAFSEAEVVVTDSQPGVTPVLDVSSDDGDMILSPGETWIYSATDQALDLSSPPPAVMVVPGCQTSRNTYENTGRVDVAAFGIFDEDLSHYCNPSDIDSDGILDEADNCILQPNGPLIPDLGGNIQRDTDGDGFGNVCDPDFNNNLAVDPLDFSLLKSVFGSTSAPDQDLNGNGQVDALDFSQLKVFFGHPPGPSGLAP